MSISVKYVANSLLIIPPSRAGLIGVHMPHIETATGQSRRLQFEKWQTPPLVCVGLELPNGLIDAHHSRSVPQVVRICFRLFLFPTKWHEGAVIPPFAVTHWRHAKYNKMKYDMSQTGGCNIQ